LLTKADDVVVNNNF